MHISHLSGTDKSSDNLTALAAQRISALQKAVKNLSLFCVIIVFVRKNRSMVWNCTYMANYYTRIRVFFCNFALAFGKASHGLTAPRSLKLSLPPLPPPQTACGLVCVGDPNNRKTLTNN